MIVITTLNTTPRILLPGDRFQLLIKDDTGCQVMIDEEIVVMKTINFVASFRFALEDGTCPGFHLTGIFANQAELPVEIQNAKMLDDLTPEQRRNFVASVGTKVCA